MSIESYRVVRRRRTKAGGWDEARVRAAALSYARTGVRSSRDVRAFLARRGMASSGARRVLAECRTRGLVDDRAAARLWAEQWARAGYAWAAIRLKLAAKGFDAPAIVSAGERLARASDDEARARLVAAQRPGHHAGVARRLAARGYEPDLIERVLGTPPDLLTEPSHR